MIPVEIKITGRVGCPSSKDSLLVTSRNIVVSTLIKRVPIFFFISGSDKGCVGRTEVRVRIDLRVLSDTCFHN